MLFQAALFFTGSAAYALTNILSQLSKEPDGSYAYSLPTVVLLSEATKLCLSAGFLRSEVGTFRGVLSAVGASSKGWLPFLVPSVLYGINNMLDMLNNQYMDPATEQVLVQSKILTTALAWRIVFQTPLSTRKWLSLVLLFCGEVLVGQSARHDKGDSDVKTMFIKPIGFVIVAFYCCISASASVYNEWVLKVNNASESIHACNIRLYACGCVFLLGSHVLSTSAASLSPGELTRGYNVYTWGLVITFASLGLILAQIMKFFDNIVKLFISGSSIYVSSVLSWGILGFVPTPAFLVALVVVTAAILLFNFEKICPPPRKVH